MEQNTQKRLVDMRLELRHFRLLDVVDLFIMKYLLEGKKYKEISSRIHIGNAAICHRVTKFKDLYGKDIFFYFTKHGSRLTVSPKGREIFEIASKAIDILGGVDE